MIRKLSTIAALAAATVFGAAATTANAYHDRDEGCDNCGTVRNIERIGYREHRHHGHGGAIVGALVGGALGNTVGKGDGRKAATVGGAVVGGAIGNEHDRRHGDSRTDVAYRISVRGDDGRTYTIDQDRAFGLQRGDRVALEDGEVRPLYR